ncbi:hypothetical protein EV421DRAFT_1742215 [Armillaria borealis]|uniref:Uncharacterized protein n=1 Tax=Armillaria borealis TaxID=47425 RepID=A0AA39IY44_9AGAR|nr:hypothetical protein EV421DRAFT_1742215 [Armillaria borealis]
MSGKATGFASLAFSIWVLKTFGYYTTYLRDLLLHDLTLVANWVQSIFTTATFNFGPHTLCFRHTDSGNLPFGWCAITALRRFNPRCGGHLVLWDLKLVIDFPPGSTILILSAILKHSNTTISCILPVVCSTGLTMGINAVEEYWASLGEEELADAKKRRAERWSMGLQMFSTLEELKKVVALYVAIRFKVYSCENTLEVQSGSNRCAWCEFIDSDNPVLVALALEMKNMPSKVLTGRRYYNRNAESLVEKAKDRNERWDLGVNSELPNCHPKKELPIKNARDRVRPYTELPKSQSSQKRRELISGKKGLAFNFVHQWVGAAHSS